MIWTALYAAWNWLPYVLGGGTTVAIGLAIAAAAGVTSALKIVNQLLEMVSPLGVGLSNLIVYLFQMLGSALRATFANPSVFLLLFLFGVGGAIFVPELSPKTIKTKAEIVQCRKENVALRKSATQKTPQRKAAPKTDEGRINWSLPGWIAR